MGLLTSGKLQGFTGVKDCPKIRQQSGCEKPLHPFTLLDVQVILPGNFGHDLGGWDFSQWGAQVAHVMFFMTRAREGRC